MEYKLGTFIRFINNNLLRSKKSGLSHLAFLFYIYFI
nr:MAG TPA: hypothetical protein [Caudoviricetes sp.]